MNYGLRTCVNHPRFQTNKSTFLLVVTSLLAMASTVFSEEPTDANGDLSTATNLPGVPLEDGPEYQAVKKLPPAIPREFGYVFAMPYAISDEYSHDRAEFERMLKLLKSGGFNVVYCPYTDWRHELFKKHQMKMMVDVLIWKGPVQTDIRRDDTQRARVKAICQKVKDSDAIWGYNLWNERLDWCGDFKKLDLQLRMLRTWDPNHPVWIGTYRYLYCEHYPTPAGVMAWYDYHWARGFPWNLHQLRFYREKSAKRGSTTGKWLLIHDYNRNLYTLQTSIAHGVKTVCWFIGGPYAGREKDPAKNWSGDHHLCTIGKRMKPLYDLIGAMGPGKDVFSTPTLRSAYNKAKPAGMMANTVPFPEDHWLKVKQGEVICGFFDVARDADLGPDGTRMYGKGDEIVWVANQNAWGWQGVVMNVKHPDGKPRIISRWDWDAMTWIDLGMATQVNFPIAPADAVVLKFHPIGAEEADDAAPMPKEVPAGWSAKGEVTRIGKLLAKRGELADGPQPTSIYAEHVARTSDNQDQPPALPSGATEYPDDVPYDHQQGEAIVGVFKLKDGGEALAFANTNALAWQGVVVKINQSKERPFTLSELVDDESRWEELGPWEDINFPVKPAGSTVLRLKQRR